MDQFICASLSDTHYWHEVDMFKVPATNSGIRFFLLVKTENSERERERGRESYLVYR